MKIAMNTTALNTTAPHSQRERPILSLLASRRKSFLQYLLTDSAGRISGLRRNRRTPGKTGAGDGIRTRDQQLGRL